MAAKIVFDGSADGPGIRSLPADANDLLEERLVQHKIRALHAHRITFLLRVSASEGDTLHPL
jgi:hypothetical protein